jgi:acetyltransferase-like isoleucine patch superfamily enzyme
MSNHPSSDRWYRLKTRPLFALKHPRVAVAYVLGYLYGAYLTLRYVDDYEVFPAIRFGERLIPLRIHKAHGAKLILYGRLRVVPWLNSTASLIRIGSEATMLIEGDFSLGEDMHITISDGGKLWIGGRDRESLSGITARGIILVKQSVEIGKDALIAWDVFITDSDWHVIEGSPMFIRTSIGEHTWIGTGAKILKGAQIGANSIVAAGAVVTRDVFADRCLLVGVPARVAKESIPDWHR